MENRCRICGFMDPDFESCDDFSNNYYPRGFRGTLEGRSNLNTVYPVQRQERNPTHFSWCNNIEAVYPDWLREELKRLFPADCNPDPTSSFDTPGPSSRSPNDSPNLLDMKNFPLNQPHDASDCSVQRGPTSQENPHAQATFMYLQPQTSGLVRNNWSLPQNAPNSAQSHTDNEIPGKAPSNTRKYSNSKVTCSISYSEIMSCTKMDTKEMSSSLEASESTSSHSHSHIISTSNTSSITNVGNEWNQAKPFGKKRQMKKLSSPESHASATGSHSDNAHHTRSKEHSKETVIESGTSVSHSSATGRRQRCSFCAKNGETEAMARSHTLFSSNTKVVQCPILRAYRCEACNATGDFAHTRSYCPRIRMLEGNVRSATLALKSTRRQADGMERSTKVGKSYPKTDI